MTQDGVYKLKSGNHYCMMNQKGGCGGGGWTLAMTIDGTKVVCFFSGSFDSTEKPEMTFYI